MKLLLCIVLLTISKWVMSQEQLRVIKFEGCIQVIPSTRCLEKNDLLNLNDSICFVSSGDFAFVANAQGSWFTLRITDTTGISGGKIFSGILSNFLEQSIIDTTKSTTRGSGSSANLNLKQLIGQQRLTVIGDELHLTVNSRDYLLSPEKFMVADYKIDTNHISKRLGFREQVLRIQKKSLSDIYGEQKNLSSIKGIQLYFYEPETKNADLVVSFDLVFVTLDELFIEFNNVFQSVKDRGTREIYHALEHYFNTCYGLTDPTMLKSSIEEFLSKK